MTGRPLGGMVGHGEFVVDVTIYTRGGVYARGGGDMGGLVVWLTSLAESETFSLY